MPCATARSAAFADAKAVKGGRARSEAVAPVNRIVPLPRGSMRRAASRPVTKPPKQASRQTDSNAASPISSSGLMCALPAL